MAEATDCTSIKLAFTRSINCLTIYTFSALWQGVAKDSIHPWQPCSCMRVKLPAERCRAALGQDSVMGCREVVIPSFGVMRSCKGKAESADSNPTQLGEEEKGICV